MSISEYNEQLINNMIYINIFEYFKNIHSKFYKNINLSFIEYFLEINNKDDDFIIDNHKLKKYKIITSNKSSEIKECLNKFELTENIDFIILNIPNNIDTTIKYTKEYRLTPYAFKLCLIRSKSAKIYSNYYLILEKIYKYYHTYLIKYNNKLINVKEEELHKLNKKNKKKNKKIDELHEFIKELTSH